MNEDTKFIVFVAVVGGIAWYMLKPKTAAASVKAADGINKDFTGQNPTTSDDPLEFNLHLDPMFSAPADNPYLSVGASPTSSSAAGETSVTPGQLSVDWDSLKTQSATVPSPLPPPSAAPTGATSGIKRAMATVASSGHAVGSHGVV